MTDLLLSVVVPVHNAADYLMPLADAFARQASGSFEVIFVDDGSTDGSDLVLARILASGTFRAVVVRQENGGASAARNAGMERASGRYVSFVDADDMIAPDYVKALLACAAEDGELYVFRHTRVVHEEAAFDNLAGGARAASADELLESFLRNPTRYGVYDFLMRADAIRRAGLRFPEGYPYYEDYDFTLRLFDAARGARVVERCVYCYRAVPGSAMSTFSDERLRCMELFDEARSQYLGHRQTFFVKYRKWFASRLHWSVFWQACVALDARAAREFARRTDMRRHMWQLADYPDRRVRWSARTYVLCPGIAISLLKGSGRGRTLIPGGGSK